MEAKDLSKRLLCVANMVTPGNKVCDVGCDHGFLSIYLVENGISPFAIASDLRDGPLSAAAEHISLAGLSKKIETRLSDGLSKIEAGEADSLVIAGMGGPLILDILEKKPKVRDSFKEIVIGPQSKIDVFREGLKSQNLVIIDEAYVYEDGKYYPIIKVKAKKQCTNSKEDEQTEEIYKELLKRIPEDKKQLFDEVISNYGAFLIYKKDSVFGQFLENEARVLREIVQNLDATEHAYRMVEIKKKLELNQLALHMCS